MRKGADISARLVKVASATLRISERLPKHAAGRHVSLQLVRSGTGGGSNYEEARAAESAADFAHKVLIAAKEVRETLYWLSVLQDAGWLTADITALVSEVNQLSAILAASARTARRQSP
ncbi:MAG: four helix bundle protein [Deltaproteobacteria bacterium]|nr:four helix bundle protein [Deltaproteobacteria bacterium]